MIVVQSIIEIKVEFALNVIKTMLGIVKLLNANVQEILTKKEYVLNVQPILTGIV